MTQMPLNLTMPEVWRGLAGAVAIRHRDAAIKAGASKARRVDPSFVDDASAHMLAYLADHGVSSGELLTDSCKLAGIRPPDDRHFGAVFMALLRSGRIHSSGECRRVKGHHSAGGKRYALGSTEKSACK